MDNLTHGGDIYSLRQPGDVLDFSTNINPLGIHPDVKKAVVESIDDCVHYPDPLCRELTAGIAAWEHVPESSIACGNGAADLIFRLVQLIKPRRALLLAPTFSEYECALLSVGCNVEYTDLIEAEGFQLTERALDLIHAGLDMMFVCNPNNPTGLLADTTLMLRILEACTEKGVLLVVDECFNSFLDDPDQHSLKQQLSYHKNLFLLKAFTKLYAIPGLRLGYDLCSDEALMDGLRRCGQAWSVSIPAQAAGMAALKLEGYLKQTHVLVTQQRSWLKEQLSALGMHVYDSAANYIFVKCAEKKLKKYLLGKDILIRSCANYRGLADGYYRFAVLNEQANQQLIHLIKHGIEKREISI